ncbi:MAG: indolepyruvate ferredoxin oxidoreductase family protein [Pseudomonadales bacterium]
MTIQPQADFSLADRYQKKQGHVLLSGIQALVRALSTRAELDRQRALHTGGFVSGYRGSPLGGLDKELWAQAELLKQLNIQFQPGVNEDLAATAVWGSQQVGLHPGNNVDGVFGLWYGKAPGLDRSCDAIRHANNWGTSANGGVLLVVGDDPAAKSSSLSTQSEFTLQDMMVPVLTPASVQDVLDYAVLGWEMSRHTGLWVGLKAIADHMDSSAAVAVGLERYAHCERSTEGDRYIRINDTAHAQEQRLLEEKLPAAIEFARQARLNTWVTPGKKLGQSLGIITAGKAYADVREALAMVGLVNEQQIAEAGIELLKLGMTWPLDDQLIVDFAGSVDTLLVVEEKRAFVETQVKEILYHHRRTTVLGKRDRDGAPLISQTGILEPADIAAALYRLTGGRGMVANVGQVLARIEEVRELAEGAPARQERTPLFCAGCPHNTSTRVPEDSRATAGIGCHYMAQWMERSTDSCTQMGGEGVTWLGEAPFTEEKHIFANLGDGTYFHSGLLAIRQAVAAGVNITYKVLVNDAVAMTGGQPTDGELTVAGLVAQVRAEGVSRVVVVSDEPEQHLFDDVDVYHRRELDKVQRELREIAGTTVLIYQQACATELRRKRKRGLVEDMKPRVVINEAVCEGCGDCSEKSGCVAVEPLATAQGEKRRINQTACNKDLSCADGFCPAFVEVSGELAKPAVRHESQNQDTQRALPEPACPSSRADILITGVGGTGIVTLSALLAVAARIEGRWVKTLDMTGLAQKGGAVFSHVRISDQPVHTPRIPMAGATTLLGCDLISAASTEAVEMLNQDTLTVANSHVLPTADFVLGRGSETSKRRRGQRLKRIVSELHEVAADEEVQALFGNTAQANVFAMGYAYQLGGIPLKAANIERAIELNGFAVEQNLQAFRCGRRAALGETFADVPPPAEIMQLDALTAQHRQWLTDYQDESLVQRYQQLVERVAQAEQTVLPGSQVLSRAVAESYVKLLMIKDEYEVARLYTDGRFERALAAEFGEGVKVRYLLAPPLMGEKKHAFGAWMRYGFKLLNALRPLRNTRLDPFAYTQERRQSLALLSEFEDFCATLCDELNVQNLSLGVALAKLYKDVRGFGHVKARHRKAMQARKAALLEEFLAPAQPVNLFDPSQVVDHQAA